ncbi:hypothetical protein JCM10908_004272 [Rhodotorula pacifica]|uniref:uncharacterized protein n=1 Tax=Rhodotorula pacifica TaxID=1495444 RepID=UPI0031717F48
MPSPSTLYAAISALCAATVYKLYRRRQLHAWSHQIAFSLGLRRSMWPPMFYSDIFGRGRTELADCDIVLGEYWEDLYEWFTEIAPEPMRRLLYRGPIIVPFIQMLKESSTPRQAAARSLWAMIHLFTKYNYIKNAVQDPRSIRFISLEIIAFAEAHGCTCLTSVQQVDEIFDGITVPGCTLTKTQK